MAHAGSSLVRFTLTAYAVCNSLLLHAQQGTDSLVVCNAGKLDVDVIVAKQGQTALTKVAPRACATVYHELKGIPAYVGFAFADSHGQWGATRRTDIPPDFGFLDRVHFTDPVLNRADQTVVVRHGAKDVSVPTQLLFQPPSPVCHAPMRGTAEAHLPSNATSGDRALARGMDSAVEAAGAAYCDQNVYQLDVTAFPETREISFHRSAGFLRMTWDDLHQALAKAHRTNDYSELNGREIMLRGTVSRVDLSAPGASEPWLNIYFRESAEQASNAHETVYGAFNACTLDQDILVEMFGPNFAKTMIGKVVDVEGKPGSRCKGWQGGIRIQHARQIQVVDPARAVEPPKKSPEPSLSGGACSPSAFNQQWFNKWLLVRGTVARADVKETGFTHWVTVFFQESPEAKFGICSPGTDVFEGKFGDKFAPDLVGQTLDVFGQVEGSMCGAKEGSIRVVSMRQLNNGAAFGGTVVKQEPCPSAQASRP